MEKNIDKYIENLDIAEDIEKEDLNMQDLWYGLIDMYKELDEHDRLEYHKIIFGLDNFKEVSTPLSDINDVSNKDLLDILDKAVYSLKPGQAIDVGYWPSLDIYAGDNKVITHDNLLLGRRRLQYESLRALYDTLEWAIDNHKAKYIKVKEIKSIPMAQTFFEHIEKHDALKEDIDELSLQISYLKPEELKKLSTHNGRITKYELECLAELANLKDFDEASISSVLYKYHGSIGSDLINAIKGLLPEYEETIYVENMEEDIEKHDELNPKLFEGNNLKEDVKNALLDIVNAFVEDLKENEVDIKIKDAVIIGSNVSYNYTKDSDLDLHIIADTENSKYSEDLLTLLYSAYRSIFNKNYDITIKGIPCEVYVELDSVQANSNGIYSLYNGWIKEPEQKDIPDIDKEEFDKLFKEWEDKYFNLLDGKVDTKNSLNENYNSLPFRKYALEDEDECLITFIEDEKKLIEYISRHPEVAYVILYQLSNHPGYEHAYETSLLWDSETDNLGDLIRILDVDYDEESVFIEAMHPEIELGWRGEGKRLLLDADTLTNYKKGDIVEIEVAPDLPSLKYKISDGYYLDDEAIEDDKWMRDTACSLDLQNSHEVADALTKKLKSEIISDIEKNSKNNHLDTRFGGSSNGFPDMIRVQLPFDKRIVRGDHEDVTYFDAE